MVYQYYASSPVLVSQPPSLPSTSVKRHIPKYPTPPSLNYLARTSNGVAGRKRSRDGEDDHSGELEAATRPISTVQAQPEPVMGPGMTLVYPENPTLNVAAESQSGTWLEERASNEDASRPRLVARKSRCRIEDLPNIQNLANDQQVDPLARELGIGWKRLSEAQQSAIAGSETFIRRQYDMVDPKVILHHEGLALFLVKSEPPSAQGYWNQWWLFRDDLNSCRFLCNDDSQLVSRLGNKRQDERSQWVPDILCEGPETFAKDCKDRQVTLINSLASVTNKPPQFKESVFPLDVSMNTGDNITSVLLSEDVEMSIAC